MKNCILLFLGICLSVTAFAQVDERPIYLRFPTIPLFNLTRVADSSKFTRDDLSKKKATIFMIFSPDCDHCQQETRAIIANINLFKKAQIVMVSPLEYRILLKFYQEYNIADHPNIIMGRDPGYFFGTYFNVKSLPAIFVYDKKGRFVKAFDGGSPVKDIADAL